MKWSLSALILIVAMVTLGCGGGDVPTDTSGVKSPPPREEKPEAAGTFPAEQASARIAGKVLFGGDPPPREAVPAEKIAASKDEFCEHHHRGAPVLVEDLIVSKAKAIRNVLVYVKKFPQAWTHATLKETVAINQKGCTYVPHVVGVMVDQPVVMTSSDDTAHNVHLVARRNRGVNFTQSKGDKKEMTFKRPELGSAYFKCDIHSWMKSHVGVFDHPFFIVTGDDGSFELGKLPPGDYEIEAWHETLGTLQQTVTLKDGETATLDFTFSS